MSKLIEKYSFVILFIVITFIFGLYLTFSAADDQGSSLVEIKVQQGDTLWELSQEYGKSLSLSEKEFIEWVTSENKLSSHTIKEGDTLVLPVQSEDYYTEDDIQLASED
ncbi:cell division suppressor protein YneA [Jeotgalibacillus proteolyticus]|uniref:cell division suppressor protein YneA n=1 Tax=Jeotgalibacillus proteolyticus TaxID=2082395 RepID=UPI003CF9B3A6